MICSNWVIIHRTFLHILSREALSNWSIINKEKNSSGGIGYLPFLVYIYIYEKCVLGLHMKPRKISIMENNFYVKGHDHVNSINDLSTNLIYVHHWERPPPTPSWGSSPFPSLTVLCMVHQVISLSFIWQHPLLLGVGSRAQILLSP